MVFDTVHQALISHTGARTFFSVFQNLMSWKVYTYLVTHYNDGAELGQIVWYVKNLKFPHATSELSSHSLRRSLLVHLCVTTIYLSNF
jgi:hypothetical protein